MSRPLEKTVEREGSDYAIRRGWREYKTTSTSHRGFPDRFYARRGVIILVEWKRDAQEAESGLSGNQRERHKELRAAGVRVEVIWSMEQAREIFE